MPDTEKVRFHFDPLCPWAWQSSKWMRETARVRDIAIDWRLFSLGIINADEEDPSPDQDVMGMPPLRALALVRRESGNEGVGEVYRAMGTRIHEGDEDLTPETVRAALADAGLDPGLAERAVEDDSTIDAVRMEHEGAVSEVGAFGVPTLVFEEGRGIFGPVVSRAPSGEEAGELWDHVRVLACLDGFFELKRERDRRPGE